MNCCQQNNTAANTQDSKNPPLLYSYEDLKAKGFIESNLHRALEQRNWDEVKRCLKKGGHCFIRMSNTNKEMNLEQIMFHERQYRSQMELEIDYRDHLERLPIHIAAQARAPVEIFDAIYNLRPRSICERNIIYDDGMALHMMCKKNEFDEKGLFDNQNVPDSIIFLAQKHPGALFEIEKGGGTPLHYILEHNPPPSLVEQMLKLIHRPRDLLRKEDVEGQLPLHVAVEYLADERIIEFLVSQYSDATWKMEKNNHLPLHFAAKFGCSKNTLEILLEQNPVAVMKRHHGGDTPLHLVLYDFHAKYNAFTGESNDSKKPSFQFMMLTMLHSFYNDAIARKGETYTKKALFEMLFRYKSSFDLTVCDLVEKNDRHPKVIEIMKKVRNDDFSFFEIVRKRTMTKQSNKRTNVSVKQAKNKNSSRLSVSSQLASNHDKEEKVERKRKQRHKNSTLKKVSRVSIGASQRKTKGASPSSNTRQEVKPKVEDMSSEEDISPSNRYVDSKAAALCERTTNSKETKKEQDSDKSVATVAVGTTKLICTKRNMPSTLIKQESYEV